MQVRSLCWEDPMEEGMTTHSSILICRIPMDRGASQATVHRITKSWTKLKRLNTNAHVFDYINQQIIPAKCGFSKICCAY